MKSLFGGAIVIQLGVVLVYLFLSGLSTQYTLEYWLSQQRGKTVDVPGLPCYLLGPFIGSVSIPAGALTWIVDAAQTDDIPTP